MFAWVQGSSFGSPTGIVQGFAHQNSFAAPSFASVILAVSQALLGVTYRVYEYAFVALILCDPLARVMASQQPIANREVLYEIECRAAYTAFAVAHE